MGMPVIAGDLEARADLEALGIPCPWTFANTRDELRDVIERLCTDSAFYVNEAARAHAYVRRYHDYHVVGERYRTLLTEALRGPADG